MEQRKSSGVWGNLAKLVVAGLAIWGGLYWYISNYDSSESGDSSEMSAGSKIEQRFEKSILESTDIIENDSLTAFFDEVTYRLLAENENLKPDSVNIYLVDQDVINAFATVGNNIFVTEDLVEFVRSKEQLVAVIAHEIGHLDLNHPMNRLKMELGSSVISSILTGGNSSMMLELSQAMMSLKFSRSQEMDADNKAIELLIDAELDPQHLSEFLLKLKVHHSSSSPVTFLSTHPQSEDRITNIIDHPLPEGFKPQVLD
ncbi:MAG: M48 family metallopeptidase [Bacteroidota bacterium]